MNNPAKQDNIIYWHRDMDNLIVNKFGGMQVFTSGLESGYLSASVVVIMNSFLAKHVCKISKVPGQLLFIKLFFKNKFSVLILGLYIGASPTVWFSQTGNVNSFIAKAVNESSFVILSGDFNESSFHKCTRFKRCLDLGLVNSLVGSLAVKKHTWKNSRDVMDSGAGSNHICFALFDARKSYCAAKLAEFLRAKKTNIRSAIDKKIESFEINKEYVFDEAFSGVMCLIEFDELVGVVSNLPKGKAANLLSILNELWKHCDKVVLDMLLTLLNFCLFGELMPSSWKEAWVSMIFKPYK
ncbi:hypothetical protein G9A89_021504 [Geosiphon pyriformis]|nr:hypothetical protein G9A89_021504 [Geosiphon pyriformis]